MPNIKVKGQAGNVLTFENVERVLFDSADDSESTVPFSYGDVTEIAPVALALGDGDQMVTAPDGTLLRTVQIKKPEDLSGENIRYGKHIAGVDGTFIGDTEEATVDLSMADGNQVVEPSGFSKVLSKVTITKPETLIPENIAEGIDIAGIIGTFVGGANAKYASGSFTSNSNAIRSVEHNMGVVPDVVVLYTVSALTQYDTTYRTTIFAFGISSAFDALVSFYSNFVLYGQNKTFGYGTTNYIDLSTDYTFINSANENTFTLGTNIYRLPPGYAAFKWIAIGGLT